MVILESEPLSDRAGLCSVQPEGTGKVLRSWKMDMKVWIGCQQKAVEKNTKDNLTCYKKVFSAP